MKITQNFRIEEFKCPCCGRILDSLPFRGFVARLQDARAAAGIPFVITSGCRCSKHNKRIGGNSDSSHLKGMAADILIKNSSERYLIIKSLMGAGFNRLGIGKSYIHVDNDTDKPQYLIWIY